MVKVCTKSVSTQNLLEWSIRMTVLKDGEENKEVFVHSSNPACVFSSDVDRTSDQSNATPVWACGSFKVGMSARVCRRYLSSSSFSLKAALKTLILSIKGLQSCFRSGSTLCAHTHRRTQ